MLLSIESPVIFFLLGKSWETAGYRTFLQETAGYRTFLYMGIFSMTVGELSITAHFTRYCNYLIIWLIFCVFTIAVSTSSFSGGSSDFDAALIGLFKIVLLCDQKKTPYY